MSSKSSYIWGIFTIVTIGGVIIYAIKKSKDAEKEESEEITLAEARKIVAEGRPTMVNDKHNVKVTVGPFNMDGVQTSFELSDDASAEVLQAYAKADVEATRKVYELLQEQEHEEEETEPEDEENDVAINDGEVVGQLHNMREHYENKEEDEELRYEPNSRDARNQFIKMELADWRPLEDVYQTMTKLFDFPFRPENDGDEMLRTQIIDYRAQFFGFNSQWTQDISIADIILHFARSAEFNIGESVRYWVEYFLDFNELDFTQPSHNIDDMIKRLNTHTYYNEERQTFGLFGLSRGAMDQSIKIANMNVDRQVTYQIEFNEFLKSCI